MAGEEFTQEVTIGGEISAAPHNDAWDNIEDWLNPRLAGGASGNLILCDSNGDPRPVAMSGDATIAASGAVTVADGSVDATDLNSELHQAHRLITKVSGRFQEQMLGSSGAGPYAFQNDLRRLVSDPAAIAVIPFAYDPAWFALTGKITQFVLRGVVVCESAPASTSTVGLYEYDTIGAVQQADLVAGSGWAVSSLSTGAIAAPTGVAFTAPAAGVYAFGVYFNSTTSASMDIEYHVQLYARYA